MFTKAFLVLAARWLATGAMSAGLLWVIVGHLGPETAEVVVHVWDVPSVVTIDGASHQMNSVYDQPITLELRGGWHDLTLRRDGVVAFQDRFYVTPGSDLSFGVYSRNPQSVALPSPPVDLEAGEDWRLIAADMAWRCVGAALDTPHAFIPIAHVCATNVICREELARSRGGSPGAGGG